ncbi:MAG: hypothetical protein KA035_03615 [Candidatus Levybacteria bacterium]|nr:hypothetical protein [Candidatus Levybacteria bacterium]
MAFIVNSTKKKLSKFLNSIKKAPDRKHYLEFVTAALSIPVLLTVILVNINNLNASKATPEATPAPSTPPREIIIRENTGSSNNTNVQPTVIAPTNTEICKKEVGPIAITSPKEGSTVTDNPVNFVIKHDEAYCSVVWSYRINNGSWSEYSSNAPSIYNMPNGNVRFQLRVQSTVSNDTDSIELNFNYQGGSSVNTPAPTSTPSLTPTP